MAVIKTIKIFLEEQSVQSLNIIYCGDTPRSVKFKTEAGDEVSLEWALIERAVKRKETARYIRGDF